MLLERAFPLEAGQRLKLSFELAMPAPKYPEEKPHFE